jgi:hypothetical protein
LPLDKSSSIMGLRPFLLPFPSPGEEVCLDNMKSEIPCKIKSFSLTYFPVKSKEIFERIDTDQGSSPLNCPQAARISLPLLFLIRAV